MIHINNYIGLAYMGHIYDTYKQLYWISLSWAISMIYINNCIGLAYHGPYL